MDAALKVNSVAQNEYTRQTPHASAVAVVLLRDVRVMAMETMQMIVSMFLAVCISVIPFLHRDRVSCPALADSLAKISALLVPSLNFYKPDRRDTVLNLASHPTIFLVSPVPGVSAVSNQSPDKINTGHCTYLPTQRNGTTKLIC